MTGKISKNLGRLADQTGHDQERVAAHASILNCFHGTSSSSSESASSMPLSVKRSRPMSRKCVMISRMGRLESPSGTCS